MAKPPVSCQKSDCAVSGEKEIVLLFTRAIRKTASSTLSAASQLIFAHKMALPSYRLGQIFMRA